MNRKPIITKQASEDFTHSSLKPPVKVFEITKIDEGVIDVPPLGTNHPYNFKQGLYRWDFYSKMKKDNVTLKCGLFGEGIMSNAMLDAGLVLDIIKVPTDIIYSYDTSKFTKLVDYKEEKFKTISQDTIDDYGYGFNYGYGGWHTKYSTKTCDTTYENDVEEAYCMICGDHSWSQGYCAEHLPTDLVANMSPASKALHADKIDYC